MQKQLPLRVMDDRLVLLRESTDSILYRIKIK